MDPSNVLIQFRTKSFVTHLARLCLFAGSAYHRPTAVSVHDAFHTACPQGRSGERPADLQ